MASWSGHVRISTTRVFKAGLTMKIEVTDQCTGHGRCYSELPDLFEDGEAGYASAAGDGLVPEERREDVERAMVGCPEDAIRIVS